MFFPINIMAPTNGENFKDKPGPNNRILILGRNVVTFSFSVVYGTWYVKSDSRSGSRTLQPVHDIPMMLLRTQYVRTHLKFWIPSQPHSFNTPTCMHVQPTCLNMLINVCSISLNFQQAHTVHITKWWFWLGNVNVPAVNVILLLYR